MDCYCPLPEDLVVDILLMLSVEPLLHFKCVCKHWYALIKSESFIEKHFHHKNNHTRLLICNLKLEEEEHTLVKSSVVSLLPEKIVPGVTPEQKILLHLPRIDHFNCVAGPVNGLFLLQELFCGYDVHLSLWNPATREFRPLPPAPFATEHFLCDYDHEFGLGFDQLTQDYKAVQIQESFDVRGQGQGYYLHMSVSVYSSCDNSWKKLQFPSSFTSGFPYSVTYLNGVYYWICSSLNNNICKIQSFAMGSEQFGEMQGPGKHWVRLTLCGESLAILVSDKCMTSIYEMKQEGSWSKVFTVQPRIDTAHLPKNIWENDKIVFELTETSQLVLYDPTRSQVTDLGIQLRLIGCRVFNYQESLALITKGNESQDQDNTDRANEVVQLLGGRMMSRIEN
ncbi:putative F-box protein At3g10430 [Solanum tuberosum]|uniref:F-box family protein n=1 Tax=Solanum tuberosum TaxID=4113 RepID=M1DIX1_SOLTU|nr:PREDICTED: putative F-box protein At3g10430 [Solanum tuberosum]XP_006356324.1 PREDICTED: putative F-box protein At3g10430 [Solanum tuberosum]KAH0693793.1 hypothetical protein KY285_020890 [Solanum tuberosum]